MTTPTRLTLIGNLLSPYVRKVVAICEIKGLAYELDPIVPFLGNEKFTALNPLRRIPILIHDGAVIADSTVIAEYLEDIAPTPAVLPTRAVDRAKARWIDEYADTRMGDVFIWSIFGKAVVAPAIFGAPRDLDAVNKAVREDLPQVMDDLEKLAPAAGGLFGAYGLADISTAVHFANLRWARQTVDAVRWPRAAAWIKRVETETPLARVTALAEKVLRVRPEEHRGVLTANGVAVSASSVAGATPQRGPMTPI